MRPHRRQPTRLPRPWDSPDKNTGVGCHFLLQCMNVKSESEVAQSFLTLSDPMDYSLPASSVHGIFQARVLEQGAIAFSRCSLKYINTSQIVQTLSKYLGFPGGSNGKGSCLQCRRPGFDPWDGRSSGGGNDYPLQYSCLENSMDGGAG